MTLPVTHMCHVNSKKLQGQMAEGGERKAGEKVGSGTGICQLLTI